MYSSHELTLLQILEVIPEEIRQYLSDSDESLDHCHKSLIVNLACGQTVHEPAARDSLLEG